MRTGLIFVQFEQTLKNFYSGTELIYLKNMMKRLLFCAFILVFAGTTYAQLSRKEKRAAKKGTAVDQPTSLSPGEASGDHKSVSRKREKSSGPTHNSQKEFENRMNARAKTNRKNEKMMSSPQYSDPAYFGHKRPPKKRSPKKMKFCKECGIRH
jgi:hypothetical protein